jgi:hypothetical protein
MKKRTARSPFGGNPFGAPSLPFNLKMPDPFAPAKGFDNALGLDNGFANVKNPTGFGDDIPAGRQRRSRKRQFAIERQQRLAGGQAPLSPEEQFNASDGNKDWFGNPNTEY